MLSTLYIPAVTCICSSSMCATRSSEQRCVVCTTRCAVESISRAATQLFQEVILASCPSVRFERTIFFVLLRSRIVSIVPVFTFIKLPHCNSIFVVNTHPSIIPTILPCIIDTLCWDNRGPMVFCHQQHP